MFTQRYTPLPADFYSDNRNRLAAQLPANSLVIVHSNDIAPTNADGTMPFHQNANLFYLCGIDQEESILLMRVGEDGAHEDTLLLRETNDTIAIWEGARLDQAEGGELSGISDVCWIDDYQALLAQWVPSASTIWVEMDNHQRRLTYVQSRNERMSAALKASYPDAKMSNIYPFLAEMRLVKSEVEIEQLRKACRITGEGYLETLKQIKPGMGEWEVEAILACSYLRRSSRKFSFIPIIASGASACVLHYLSNHNVCEDGTMLLMDIGAEYGGYAGDMTRVLPLSGTFTPRQREVYEACRTVHLKAMEYMRPGVKKNDYELQVRAFMGTQLVKIGVLTQEELDADPLSVRRYFMHGCSHSLGIDVHDVAPDDATFALNQVWTIEPGIYIREEGIGYRLETDVVIREDGVEDLLGFVPLASVDVEAAMRA